MKENFKSLKELRSEAEKKQREDGQEIEVPDYERRKKEALEEKPFLLFVISDSEGRAVRQIKKPVKAGVQRAVWDFRSSPVDPISLKTSTPDPWESRKQGYMIPPGEYTVTMYRYQDGGLDQVDEPQTFTCSPLNIATIPPADLEALNAFNKKVAALARAISAADAHHDRLKENLPYLEQAVLSVPEVNQDWLAELSALKLQLREVNQQLNGDPLLVMDEGQYRMSLKGRTDLIMGALWSTTSGATGTYERAYEEAHAAFGEALAALEQVNARVLNFEAELEKAGAPYTPGRMPTWDGE